MSGRKVAYIAVASLLFQSGVSWATTPACSVDVHEARQAAVAPAVVTMKDPATGATIRLEREASGRIVVELKSGAVLVRKELTRGSSVTTLAFGAQRVVLGLKGDDLTVTASGETSQGSVSKPDTLVKVLERLRQSAPAQAAKDLLNRATLHADSLEGNALLLTRALLGSIGGDDTGTRLYHRWASTTLKQPRIVKAGLSSGPGECWDTYVAEANRIANDYLECGNSCHWQGYLCMLSCGTLYDIRAEAAFMWFMSCSGGFFVGG